MWEAFVTLCRLYQWPDITADPHTNEICSVNVVLIEPGKTLRVKPYSGLRQKYLSCGRSFISKGGVVVTE